MGEIFSWKGRRAQYHYERDFHGGQGYELAFGLNERPLHGIFIEGTPAPKGVDEWGRPTAAKMNLPYNQLRVSHLMEQAEQHGVDVWTGDHQDLRAFSDLLVPIAIGAVAAAHSAYESRKFRRKPSAAVGINRRSFLRRSRDLALMGAAGALGWDLLGMVAPFAGPRMENGKPAANRLTQTARSTTLRHFVKGRDELAAAKIDYMTRHTSRVMEERGVSGKPVVGAVYGMGHDQISQLIEDKANYERVLERVRDDPKAGFIYRFHYDQPTNQWSVEEHHLLGPEFLAKLRAERGK